MEYNKNIKINTFEGGSVNKMYRVTFEYYGYETVVYDGEDYLYAIEMLLMNSELNPVIEEYEPYRLHVVK